jgi:hypothetical protein
MRIDSILEGVSLTDAIMALFRVWKIFLPCTAALAEPMNRAPTEQMDKRRSAFSVDGRKDGACIKGRTGLNLAK